MKKNAFAKSLIAAIAILGVASAFAIAGRTTAQSIGAIGVHGIEAPLSLQELATRADVVVIGVAGADAVRPFTANPQVPASERDPRIYARGAYHDLSFRVFEYVKGSGPEIVSIRRFAPSPTLGLIADEAPGLVTGQQYALFLQRGESVWTGGYIVLGSRGVGRMMGNAADFAASFGRVDIAELRRAARNP